MHMKKHFSTAIWYGVERNELAARVAEASGITVFRSNDPKDWRLPVEGFDGIVIGDAHAYGTPQAMKSLVRLLKPGGWLVGCFANRYYFDNIRQYLDPANAQAQHQATSQYSAEQVSQLYLQAGFTYVKITRADNKPQEQLEYIHLLERLTSEEMSKELTAAYLLVYGRLASAVEIQDTADLEGSKAAEEAKVEWLDEHVDLGQ